MISCVLHPGTAACYGTPSMGVVERSPLVRIRNSEKTSRRSILFRRTHVFQCSPPRSLLAGDLPCARGYVGVGAHQARWDHVPGGHACSGKRDSMDMPQDSPVVE